MLLLLNVHVLEVLSEQFLNFADSVLHLGQFNSALLVQLERLGVALLHRLHNRGAARSFININLSKNHRVFILHAPVAVVEA